MKPILVLGTTPYAAVFVDSFEACQGVRFDGCVENLDRARCAERILHLPIHWFEDIDPMKDSHLLACALGTTRRADWIAQMEERGFGFATLVHPSSVVSARTEMAAGVSVDMGAVIAGFSTIDAHVRIGRRTSIGHHTMIGACSTIHPGSIISGNCRIGRQVTIGTGAVVIDGIEIGDGAVIAAGAVVNRPVAPRSMVAGNPAGEKQVDYGPR
ncbi:acetyltransferase [Defluviimonas sp. WL0002]|uniref:Acetyltransferase n=1 Tax=Albidovulum marisflavi TaxID=2984159 RepID=A0ABT2ZD23_9RHOB|nr:acetyltransferase [Defluviimonas sp. WL0002]MCV2869045.1 acetyltransferase [Defluviimonas sp. WL0002]